MNFRTDRKNALGMGSGREGTHHHWQMMISSIALVFVVPLFVVTFGTGLGGSYDEVLAFYSRPVPAIIVAICLVVGIRHFKNEALEAIEDYVHGMAGRLAIFGTTAVSYIMIAVGLFGIAKIAF
ncbi:MAG: succinate dehydrogenase, hydrophobic membrane anchor protein [Pseudomonadota bacterium]